MDKREFWSTKSKLPEYHAVVFDHPAFDAPLRLVANEFAEVTLAGEAHTPAAMGIKAPDQKGDSLAKLTLSFPRQFVGREFKRQLRLIAASGSRDPIAITYSIYTGDTSAPQVSWHFFAADPGGVVFSPTEVQVTATVDNVMRRAVGLIYDPAVFSGLELI